MNRRELLKIMGAAAAVAAWPLVPFSLQARQVPDDFERTRLAMGTFVSIQIAGASLGLAEDAVNAAFAEMDRLIAMFDRRDPASAVHALNAAGRLDGPPELVQVMHRALTHHAASGGRFDPTVAPLVDVLREAGASGRPLDFAELAAISRLADGSRVHIEGSRISLGGEDMAVTLDGIAKGRIADAMASVLVKSGVESFCIDAGGDIRVQGVKAEERPWIIGVRDPNGGEPVAVLHRMKGAVASSGTYEMVFDKARGLHHLIDPGSAEPTKVAAGAVAGTTVCATTAMEADALATSLCLMDPLAGRALVESLPGREALIVTSKGGRFPTSGWA
jgi:thiamine biosynthesis lipoprotein